MFIALLSLLAENLWLFEISFWNAIFQPAFTFWCCTFRQLLTWYSCTIPSMKIICPASCCQERCWAPVWYSEKSQWDIIVSWSVFTNLCPCYEYMYIYITHILCFPCRAILFSKVPFLPIASTFSFLALWFGIPLCRLLSEEGIKFNLELVCAWIYIICRCADFTA